VFKGQVEVDGTFEEVALKTTGFNATAKDFTNLASELKLMIFIGRHPNIVRLLGAYTKELRQGKILHHLLVSILTSVFSEICQIDQEFFTSPPSSATKVV